jgi:hypothetical protein
MGLAEPPGRAAGGTAPVIVVGLDGSPASGRRLRDPCAAETGRPPAPGPSACGAAASQPARYAASDAAQWKQDLPSVPNRMIWVVSPHRRSTTDLLRFGNRRAPGREDPRSCSRITEPHPRTVSLAGVAALADHLDLLPRRHLYS